MIDCLEKEGWGRVKHVTSELGSGGSLEAGNYGRPRWEGRDLKKGGVMGCW